MPTPFEANVDVTKALIGVAGTALFAIAGLVFAWIKRGEGDSTFTVPMGIGITVFFVMATVSFKQFKTYQQGQSGAIVRIDEMGVLDRRIGANLIPWSAISDAEIINISKAPQNVFGNKEEHTETVSPVMAVALKVAGASSYVQADGALSSATKGLGQLLGNDRIILSPEGLSTTANDLLAAVEAHRPQSTPNE